MLRSSVKTVKQIPDNSDAERHLTTDQAVIKLQCLVRNYLAYRRVRKLSKSLWQRVFDPSTGLYFWYNVRDKESTWFKPKVLDQFDETDVKAVKIIQKIVRGFIGRMRGRKLAHKNYTRYYDAKVNKFYWMKNSTGKTTWVVRNWLMKQEVPMPPEDVMLFDSYLKIKELEHKLKEKDKEIKEIRKKRFEELEPQVLLDKVTNARSLRRTKHMDDWKVEDLAAWFTELKMESYVPYIFANRVDGNLFINLTEEEWHEMGIDNKIHIRKLNLILRPYRIRYERRKERIEVNEEDDLLSEYAPSELSALLAAEDNAGVDEDESEDEDEEEDDYQSEEDDARELTEEEKLQSQLDQRNVHAQLLVKGDETNYPMIGDIIRIKYVCTLAESTKVVMSTKNVILRPWVEFVLGIDQTIKGFDRAIPKMSVGERAKITITPEYAYGAVGLPPHIPPNSALTFDITLLGFRPRSVWVKPLIQDHQTNERPYFQDMKFLQEMSGSNSNLFSASLEMMNKIDSPKLVQKQLNSLNSTELKSSSFRMNGNTSFASNTSSPEKKQSMTKSFS